MIKYLPTIGPACSDHKSLEIILERTSIVRLNGSHNTLDWHKSTMENIKLINPNAVILFDFPGIKPRTQNQANIDIKQGDTITFQESNTKALNNSIFVSNSIPKTTNQPATFSVNDGQFMFDNVTIGPDWIKGISQQNFTLEPHKGLNVPYSEYDEEKQIQIYMDFYSRVKEFSFDAIGLSFIQSPKTMEIIKTSIPEKILIAKIENKIGHINSESIAKIADGIMIDRGDLAAEVGGSELYDAVLHIAQTTKKNGKFLIMATENLESFIYDRQPTLSEIMSLSHSLDIGSSVIMLSGETATNQKWIEVLDWMDQFTTGDRQDLTDSSSDVIQTMTDFDSLRTVIFSRSGAAVEEFRKKSNSEIILVTDNIQTFKRFQFHSNIQTILEDDKFSRDDMDYIRNSCSKLYSSGLLVDDVIRVLWIAFPGKNARLNTISILKKEYILDK
jgi:pyruvate kinase